MLKRAAVLIAGALLCACGLDSSLAGKWQVVSFTTTVDGGFGNIVAYGQGELDISVSGGSATIANICPDYSKAVNATGSGETASWSGALLCEPIPIESCSSFTATYSGGTVQLKDSVLIVVAQGTGTGCGATSQITNVFTSSNL